MPESRFRPVVVRTEPIARGRGRFTSLVGHTESEPKIKSVRLLYGCVARTRRCSGLRPRIRRGVRLRAPVWVQATGVVVRIREIHGGTGNGLERPGNRQILTASGESNSESTVTPRGEPSRGPHIPFRDRGCCRDVAVSGVRSRAKGPN